MPAGLVAAWNLEFDFLNSNELHICNFYS
jgi:hypothetical protein